MKASFRSQVSPRGISLVEKGIGTSFFLLALWFYSDSIIPPMAHNDIFLNITVFLSQGQAGEALELSNGTVIRMSQSSGEESTFKISVVKGF
jgi:hypothetical protein